MSNRSVFLVSVLLGLLAALPMRARAKGQWCNDEHVTYQADMTLESATLRGVSIAVPNGEHFQLQSSPFGEFTARVFCPTCTPPVVPREHLGKQ